MELKENKAEMTGNSKKFSSEKEFREREKEIEISSWSHLPVQHFLVYRETQSSSPQKITPQNKYAVLT